MNSFNITPPAPTCPICGKVYSVVRNNQVRQQDIVYGQMAPLIYDSTKHVCDLVDIQQFKSNKPKMK